MAWVVPLFSLLWFTTNQTSITKKVPLHNASGHPRDQFLCAHKCEWTGPQRRPQSQVRGSRGSHIRGDVTQHDFSGRGGGGWKWWMGVGSLPGHEYCSTSERDPLPSLKRDDSDWGQGKEREEGKENWRNQFLAVCPRILKRGLSVDLWDTTPPHKAPLLGNGTPKAPGAKHTSLSNSVAILFFFFPTSTGSFYVPVLKLSDESALVRETRNFCYSTTL